MRFLDFYKVFNHVDRTIFIKKLIDLNVRKVHILCSFLSSQRQAVRIDLFVLNRQQTNTGFLQENKPGSIPFELMINDLAVKSPFKTSQWKYVDDVTLSPATGGMSNDITLSEVVKVESTLSFIRLFVFRSCNFLFDVTALTKYIVHVIYI